MLTRDAMVKALKQTGPNTPVLEAMQSDIPTVLARASLDSALRLLTEKRKPAVGVVDPDGKLIGLLTLENLGELMMLNGTRPKDRGGYAGPWSNLR